MRKRKWKRKEGCAALRLVVLYLQRSRGPGLMAGHNDMADSLETLRFLLSHTSLFLFRMRSG